jgi:exosortase N
MSVISKNWPHIPAVQGLHPVSFAAPGALLLFWMATGYFRSDALFVTGLIAMAGALQVREPGRFSRRFGWMAWVFIGLALLVPARSFHFLALVFVLFFGVEQIRGKINEAPVFMALLLTAGAKTMSVLLGFPFRLQMSENAAAALRLLGREAIAEGNMIRYDGQDFLVDTACAGLQMVEVSGLFCLLLWALLERRTGRRLRWFAQAGFLLATGVLILLFNQLRILMLVIFAIPPEDIMHDVVGLTGLIIYVFVPLWFGLNHAFASDRWSRPATSNASKDSGRRPKYGVHLLLLSGALWALALTEKTQENQASPTGLHFIPAGIPADCIRETPAAGITKFSNEEILIYVKPVRGWYDTEHTPLICWQGSGYTFGQIQERRMGNTAIYSGILTKKGDHQFYTAWWFDNGSSRTLSQARWRWMAARGDAGFSLVNVTARDPETLEKHLQTMLGAGTNH